MLEQLYEIGLCSLTSDGATLVKHKQNKSINKQMDKQIKLMPTHLSVSQGLTKFCKPNLFIQQKLIVLFQFQIRRSYSLGLSLLLMNTFPAVSGSHVSSVVRILPQSEASHVDRFSPQMSNLLFIFSLLLIPFNDILV